MQTICSDCDILTIHSTMLNERSLERARKVDSLYLQGKNIEDVHCLANAPNPDKYKTFHMDNNKIKVVPDLTPFANLVMLNLSSNRIEKLDFLNGL